MVFSLPVSSSAKICILLYQLITKVSLFQTHENASISLNYDENIKNKDAIVRKLVCNFASDRIEVLEDWHTVNKKRQFTDKVKGGQNVQSAEFLLSS